MYQVVMVCTGNICRSPMAEGMLRHQLPERLGSIVTLHSAGTYALHGNQASEHGITAMKAMGIDISGHRARQLTRDIVAGADLLLAMETHHLNAIKQLGNWSGKVDARLLGSFAYPPDNAEIDDPYGGTYEDYQACVRRLAPCIDKLIQWLDNHLILQQ